jgi:putative membrane protein insertion efficiency factor
VILPKEPAEDPMVGRRFETAAVGPCLSPLARGVVALVRAYQRLAAPGLRASCRFTPTCSDYAIQAVERSGAFIGGVRAVRRVLRCRPPNGGLDEP